jgi:hypothetical protein
MEIYFNINEHFAPCFSIYPVILTALSVYYQIAKMSVCCFKVPQAAQLKHQRIQIHHKS